MEINRGMCNVPEQRRLWRRAPRCLRRRPSADRRLRGAALLGRSPRSLGPSDWATPASQCSGWRGSGPTGWSHRNPALHTGYLTRAGTSEDNVLFKAA
jgi:hypothetical protein